MAQAEEQLDGDTDVLLFDDLAHAPRDLAKAKNVPQGYVSRATHVYQRLAGMMRQKGGALVAGLRFREGETYDRREMGALSEKCRLYNLYEEDGILYATDGYGKAHPITEAPEEPPCPTSSCPTPTTSSAA